MSSKSKKKKAPKIEELQKQIRDLEYKWKRAAADYANLEKRVAHEKEVFSKFALANFLRQLLPILDTLEEAVTHVEDEGLKMVLEQFKNILSENGVEEIEAAGKDFDPNLHEAVEMVEGEENKVVGVVKKGYKIGEKVIRVAGVRVGKKAIKQ